MKLFILQLFFHYSSFLKIYFSTELSDNRSYYIKFNLESDEYAF